MGNYSMLQRHWDFRERVGESGGQVAWQTMTLAIDWIWMA